MKVLVTGGAGYFGDLLVRRLVACGYQTRIFDLNAPDHPVAGVTTIQGDVRDGSAIALACRDIEVVFHNIAQVPLAKDKSLFWSVNRDGTRNLLEACIANGVRRVVYTSSSAIYGVPRCNPVTEQTTPAPQEDYGRAKLAGENLCWEFAKRGVEVSIIRPRTIMGHGRLGIFQILFEWIYQGRNVPVLSGGKNIYQFVHADDLADACVAAARGPASQAYNCGAKHFGTMREVLEGLCRQAGTGSQVKSLPAPIVIPAMNFCSHLGLSPLGAYHSLMYGRSMYFDISKAETELRWQPKYSNDEMFLDSYRWYVKNRNDVLSHSGGSHHQSAVSQGILKLVQKLW